MIVLISSYNDLFQQRLTLSSSYFIFTSRANRIHVLHIHMAVPSFQLQIIGIQVIYVLKRHVSELKAGFGTYIINIMII